MKSENRSHEETNQQVVYSFFTEVGIINQLISTKLESMLPGRMSATQFGILGHLSRRPRGETPLQLSNAFQVPKTSMTHMLSVLEQLQLISLAPHPDDGRSKVAKTTKKGAMFLQQTNMEMGNALAPVLSNLSDTPFKKALPHLERVRIALDEERDSPQSN